MVKPIPDTSPRVIPTLVCRNPEEEIEFCEKVLNAEVWEAGRTPRDPSGPKSALLPGLFPEGNTGLKPILL